MILKALICSQTFSLYSQRSQVVFPKKKQLKVPEFCRSDVGYLWLFLSPRGSIVLQGVLKKELSFTELSIC